MRTVTTFTTPLKKPPRSSGLTLDTITLAMREGAVTLPCWRGAHLALHRGVSAQPGGRGNWTISHHATGYSVLKAVSSRELAVQALLALEKAGGAAWGTVNLSDPETVRTAIERVSAVRDHYRYL